MLTAERRNPATTTCCFLTRSWHRFMRLAACTCLLEKDLWPNRSWGYQSSQLFSDSSKALVDYWESQRSTQWFADHPLLPVPWLHAIRTTCASLLVWLRGQTSASQDCSDLSKAVPLRLYGDGAEATRCQAIYAVNVNQAYRAGHACGKDGKNSRYSSCRRL